MDQATAGRVRRFNRTVTERVGALEETYLGRGRPLAETRLLWEIGPDGADVRDLRSALGIDAGYASRMLRSLEAQGLAAVDVSEADRRVRRVRLTDAGRAERSELDRLSDQLVVSMLEPLGDRQRARLLDAMDEVERLIRVSSVTIGVEDPAGDDARFCIRSYYGELAERFENGFDADDMPVPVSDFAPPSGLMLVARLHDRPVGCGALRHHAGGKTDIKRMWVSPDTRGMGLGKRLLGELERQAALAGATVVRLETNRVLGEAIAMYRSSGYEEVEAFNEEPYGHHWFAKRL
jgi:DNA-binding MarR family transcriptional regulator/GNAT superfamily N-acetyltransferase